MNLLVLSSNSPEGISELTLESSYVSLEGVLAILRLFLLALVFGLELLTKSLKLTLLGLRLCQQMLLLVVACVFHKLHQALQLGLLTFCLLVHLLSLLGFNCHLFHFVSELKFLPL